MGFKELFVFAIAGYVAIYWQRLRKSSDNQQQIIFLWILAVALPSLAIAWISLNQTSLPLILVVTGFLLSVWIYGNWLSDSNAAPMGLTPVEEKQLKDCFSPSVYHLKDLECLPQKIYCHGNLRSQNYQYAYNTINQNLQKIFGDRFICYLQEVPIANLDTRNNHHNIGSNRPNYCFCLIANDAKPKTTENLIFGSKILSFIHIIIGIVLTSFTLLVAGANINRLEDFSLDRLQTGLPYLMGVAGVLVLRAIAKHIARYYIIQKNKLTFIRSFNFPLLLPCIGGFGILGSLGDNNHQSTNPTAQRRILFDLVVIPTITGLIASTILLILGNWCLVPSNPIVVNSNSTIATSLMLPSLNTFDFKNSILANLIQWLLTTIFSSILSIDRSVITLDSIPTFAPLTYSPLTYSPLTYAGWTGLALSALQLMPFHLLEGGDLAIAMFGHHQATQIARIVRLVILAIALLIQPWLRIYSLLLFLLPTPLPLIVNESIELDQNRDLIGMTLMAILLLIIIPIPRLFLLIN